MHYYGGKSRLGKRLATLIEHYRKPDQEYLEPFCGSLSVTQYVTGKRTASDLNHHLITLFKAMQSGWQPPEWITKEQYVQLRATVPNDPLTAYAGVIFSFGGGWFNGYVSDYERQACQRRTLERKMKACKDVTFIACAYDQHTPVDQIIYCDPPYAGTNDYGLVGSFDHVKFWNVIRKWSETNTVLVSEYTAPPDFKCVAEYKSRMMMNQNKQAPRLEKVFTLNESPSLFRWSN